MTGSTLPRGSRARRRTALIAVVAAAGLTLAACGGGDDMDGMDHGGGKKSASASAAPGGADADAAPGAFNDADVMFAQMMIPHHEQALEMSALADGRAQDAEIKTLAAEISAAQDPEIQKMKSWLKAWGKPESAEMDHGSGHGSGGSSSGTDSSGNSGGGMAGMMSGKDLEKLKAAQGKAFDRAFAQLMIDHHRGAVDMAEDERKNGRNATAKKLAEDVVATQSTEIERLEKILGRL
ncbi:DUF305 domain-containing protein [Streptomyces yaizuensis]|uniref:DUF305 domain-containing protein n=1 Tax=Streptomyces yaizuensis TaxID=2989713 RepID=A0ABQ5NYE6_9ACTN|nr:DUF305 domain-containing protein [Streptomyces sp. YSPA8]GLF95397.1 DUF305 domain-containing protein [Streptomyces sp. YSPA8]